MYNFFTIVFYLGTIPAMIFEMTHIFSPRDWWKFINEFRRKHKEKEEMTSLEKTYSILTMLYMVWALVGLISSQWGLFAIFLVLSFITGTVMKVIADWAKPVWIVIDGILSFAILVLILLNKFHLHYNFSLQELWSAMR